MPATKRTVREHFIMIDKDLMDDPLLLCAAKKLVERDDLPLIEDALSDMELLCVARARYMCALVRFWCYADQHIRDDDTLPMGDYEVDALVGLNGFCEITPTAWLEVVNSDCVRLPGYCLKNNVVSRRKRRSDNAERMKRTRAQARAAHTDDTFNARAANVQRNTNTNTKKENSSLQSLQKKAQRLPKDWKLPPELRDWTWSKLGMGQQDIDEEVERFKDHWHAAPQTKACKLDWDATWRNWCREAVRRRKPNGSAAPRAWPTRPTQESALAAIDAASRLTTEGIDTEGYSARIINE